MNIYVFGTGNYYASARSFIDRSGILCFLDNDDAKDNTVFDGKQVKKPKSVDFSKCDCVLVMILRYQDVVSQLLSLGVKRDRIVLFSELNDLYPVKAKIMSGRRELSMQQWIKQNSDRKKVYLICHELSRNGISVVLMHLAELLKKMGYGVVLAGLLSGEIQKELSEKEIDHMPQINYCYGSREFREFIECIDYVVPGTIGISDVVSRICGSKTKILWWIHESNDRDFEDFPLYFEPGIRYFGGGTRVIECFGRHYPDKKIEKLLYFLPSENPQLKVFHKTFKIAIIGLVNRRKGQDIFIEALQKIPKIHNETLEIDFIGKYIEPVVDLNAIESEFGIHYISELTQEELKNYYTSLDLLVCPSRDDPMPVVVTQAMQNGIPCIVSNQVGQSEYINDGINGFVFESEDAEQLASRITFCLKNKEKMEDIGIKSKTIYDKYFSENAMRNNLEHIFNSYL